MQTQTAHKCTEGQLQYADTKSTVVQCINNNQQYLQITHSNALRYVWYRVTHTTSGTQRL